MELKTLIADLISSGLTQSQIADLVGSKQTTISGYHTGTRCSRPSYNIVSKIKDLHKKRCKKKSVPSKSPVRQ